MSADDAVGDYLALARHTDRLRCGGTASDTGDYLARRGRLGRGAVPSQAAASPAALVRAAGRLAADLPGAGLEPARERFLSAQVAALECIARRFTGQRMSFVGEVAICLQTQIGLGDEDAYRTAHRRLDELLVGPGALAVRLAAHRRRDEVPPDRLEQALRALTEALRERAGCRWPLPADEAVEYRVVPDAPWSALHRVLGGHRSRVTVNAGARLRWAQLPRLVAHEAYPGHHVEHCRKDAGLVTGRGWPEHHSVVAGTPQTLIAEGAAELGLHVAVGPGWGRWAQDVFGELAPAFDGELAERLDRAAAGLLPVRQDAALLLHDRHAPAEEALDHLRDWLLVSDARARQLLRLVRHPRWRTQAVTYVEGPRLVRRWLDRSGAETATERYRQLLDEPLTPAGLRAELRAEPRQGSTAGSSPCTEGDNEDDRRLPSDDER